MKKIILLSIIICLTVTFAYTQSVPKTIVIQGRVTNLVDKGIPGHPVTIFSDSNNAFNFFYYKTVNTNNDGFFSDSVVIPDQNMHMLQFNVFTVDCNNQYLNRTF